MIQIMDKGSQAESPNHFLSNIFLYTKIYSKQKQNSNKKLSSGCEKCVNASAT